MTKTTFNDLSDIYEALVDWPKRLANEAPFYQSLFTQHRVGRVLDAACGTGHHAEMFHSWGLEVQGADVAPAMIARCRQRLAAKPGLEFVVRGFDQPIVSAFDAVVCVGNSLALAPDRQTVARAVCEMLAAVRPGGLLILHVLNLYALPDGPCVWQKSRRVDDTLITKGVHRCGDVGYVDLVVTDLAGPTMQSESVPFQGLKGEDLRGLVEAAGGAETSIFGGYRQESYELARSPDLVLVAVK